MSFNRKVRTLVDSVQVAGKKSLLVELFEVDNDKQLENADRRVWLVDESSNSETDVNGAGNGKRRPKRPSIEYPLAVFTRIIIRLKDVTKKEASWVGKTVEIESEGSIFEISVFHSSQGNIVKFVKMSNNKVHDIQIPVCDVVGFIDCCEQMFESASKKVRSIYCTSLNELRHNKRYVFDLIRSSNPSNGSPVTWLQVSEGDLPLGKRNGAVGIPVESLPEFADTLCLINELVNPKATCYYDKYESDKRTSKLSTNMRTRADSERSATGDVDADDIGRHNGIASGGGASNGRRSRNRTTRNRRERVRKMKGKAEHPQPASDHGQPGANGVAIDGDTQPEAAAVQIGSP